MSRTDESHHFFHSPGPEVLRCRRRVWRDTESSVRTAAYGMLSVRGQEAPPLLSMQSHEQGGRSMPVHTHPFHPITLFHRSSSRLRRPRLSLFFISLKVAGTEQQHRGGEGASPYSRAGDGGEGVPVSVLLPVLGRSLCLLLLLSGCGCCCWCCCCFIFHMSVKAIVSRRFPTPRIQAGVRSGEASNQCMRPSSLGALVFGNLSES